MKVSAREILHEALFQVSKLRVLFYSTSRSRRPLEGLPLWLGSIQYMQSPVEPTVSGISVQMSGER